MNMNFETLTKWVFDFNYSPANNIQVIIAPSHTHLFAVKEAFGKTNIKIGAQDISHEDAGAHTGDVGAFQVKEFAQYCIIGHSERHENNKTVLAKIQMCKKYKITPIICFTNVENVKSCITENAIYAWEDPNNISQNGVYREKDPKNIQNGINEIRHIIGTETILVYGGSVNRQNIQNLVNIDGLDGVLVGNASLDPKHFLELISRYQG